MASCLPGTRGCALGLLYTVGWATALAPQPGPSAEATPRRRRALTTPPDGVGMVGSQATWALGLCHRSRPSAGHQQRPKKARCDGVERRRLLPTPSASAPPRRRRLLPPCGFSHRARGQWHRCGARETAQALQHGCGDDCSRSASLAALHAPSLALHRAVANASSTGLAQKACVERQHSCSCCAAPMP